MRCSGSVWPQVTAWGHTLGFGVREYHKTKPSRVPASSLCPFLLPLSPPPPFMLLLGEKEKNLWVRVLGEANLDNYRKGNEIIVIDLLGD
ncbi:unnamed protein product [Sphenostylis stenocarpa]|uniref:Uncharacterized protein n=1 Tax=Sphenostylis stenocarpa TaxID=92480 RepID=A0AA86VDP7_9FABA|nr:unnamed protein product [Sphenostylis stenocarpa]